MQRVGLLGGTFDPPHIGHLWLAEVARQQLRLDHVRFMPVGSPPHKTGQPSATAEQRIKMVQLAIDRIDYFRLDTTDTFREPPQFTVTLLPLMREKYPDAELWLLLGADSLRDLASWRRPADLFSFCRLAVLPRPGAVVKWDSLETSVEGVRDAVDLLDGPGLDISSSLIRQRLAAASTIRFLVPSAVNRFISDAKLYR
jgi:nicotinate-nucleotide adenylyltransferase